MESLSSSPSLSVWDFIMILLLRPIVAIGFVLSLISLGWLVAWKLVLVHVPLVQEIFGLKKKPVRSKPPTGRLSKIYSSINAQNSPSTSTWRRKYRGSLGTGMIADSAAIEGMSRGSSHSAEA